MNKFLSILSKIFLWITFVACGLCFISFFGLAFDGYSYTTAFGARYIYGWSAIYPDVLLGTGLFVFLPCLIYQAVYVIVKKRKGDCEIFKKAKKAALIFACLATVTAVSVFIAENRVKNQEEQIIADGIVKVQEYLSQFFGANHADEMDIVFSDMGLGDIFAVGKQEFPTLNYNVTKPLSEGDVTFRVWISATSTRGEVINNDFEHKYSNERRLGDQLDRQFKDLLPELPQDITVSVKSYINNFFDVYVPNRSDSEMLELFEVRHLVFFHKEHITSDVVFFYNFDLEGFEQALEDFINKE